MPLDVIKSYRPGYGLRTPFYTSHEVFARERERIFHSNWMFVGHSCEIANAGDYLTYDLAGAPLVVVRNKIGMVRALHNVCRHRGSVVCTKDSGNASLIVCPYHAWSYDLDGALRAAPNTDERFRKSEYALKRAHAEELDGLIFVNLAENPSPFAELRDHLSPILRSQGLTRAKIAIIKDYHLNVNWKTVVENNRECHHCKANHPEYVSVQYDTENDNPAMAAEIAERLANCKVRWAAAGIDIARVNTSSAYTSEWFRANRTPVRKGMVTESPDGQLVCTRLMAGFTDPDMGTARATTNVNFWCHANSDYAHTVRITPVSATETVVRGYWLVDEDAVEGRDYHAEKIAEFHHNVMSEDWLICERQWRGINSPAFEPGPFSPTKEPNVEKFLGWYIRQIAA